MNPLVNKGRVFLVLGLAGVLTACANPSSRPQSEMQTAESAIQAAQASEAREYEPVLLNQARNKVADAEELIGEEDYNEARRLLEQAAVDAELAISRTETQQARRAAEELNKSIEALSEQLDERQQ